MLKNGMSKQSKWHIPNLEFGNILMFQRNTENQREIYCSLDFFSTFFPIFSIEYKPVAWSTKSKPGWPFQNLAIER